MCFVDICILALTPSDLPPFSALADNSDSLYITCPSVMRDLLMYWPSFCRAPVDPVALTDSLPARSTRDRDDTRTGPPPPAVEIDVPVPTESSSAAAALRTDLAGESVPPPLDTPLPLRGPLLARLSTIRRKMECDRLLARLRAVDPVRRRASPVASRPNTCSGHVTISSFNPRTTTPSVLLSNIRIEEEVAEPPPPPRPIVLPPMPPPELPAPLGPGTGGGANRS
mmetsp:Transcript_38774/g.85129  ORF Transcript_38774/g.85129 Transcript_38774/m.85129 type:complete len:226 (+) Transcript_38774:528-1205(+)